MAKYRASVLTDNGLNLARQAENARIKISFTKAVLSAEDHTNDAMLDLEKLTSLNAFAQSDPINYNNILSATDVSVPLRFSNITQTTNNYINAVGLYATDGTTEVLYSVIINDDPELFPAYNNSTPQYVKINFETEVGRTSQLTVNVSPLGMVTEEELSAATKNWELSASHTADITSLASEINSVASAAGNNSGLSAEFTAVNNSISTNSTAIATLQTSVNSNSSSISSLSTSVATNSTGIANLSSSVATNSSNISTLQSSVNSSTTLVNNLNINTLKIMPVTNGIDFWGLAPGIYQFTGQLVSHNPYNTSSTLFGVGISYGNQMIYYDQSGAIWCLSPKSGSWIQLGNESDIVNLQNQVNGVLARQSNLIQTMLNNSLFWGSGYGDGNFISCNYNINNNTLTINENYQLPTSTPISANTIYSYALSMGYSTVSVQIINNSRISMTSVSANSNGLQFQLSGYNANIQGLQLQFTFS